MKAENGQGVGDQYQPRLHFSGSTVTNPTGGFSLSGKVYHQVIYDLGSGRGPVVYDQKVGDENQCGDFGVLPRGQQVRFGYKTALQYESTG